MAMTQYDRTKRYRERHRLVQIGFTEEEYETIKLASSKTPGGITPYIRKAALKQARKDLGLQEY